MAGFCKATKSALTAWFKSNAADPYPSKEVKEQLSKQTGKSVKQVNDWFINARAKQKKDKKKKVKYPQEASKPNATKRGTGTT